MKAIARLYQQVLLAALCIALPCSSATVRLDEAVQYQTIDGFGGSIAHEMWGLQSYDSSYYNQIVNDLGVSMVRLFLQPDFEPQSGVFNTTSGSTGVLLGICRKLHAAGIPRVAPTIFTPPAWMKDNNSEIGGSLRTDMYDAFAEYYVQYIRAIEQTGLQVYAISPENEPAWAQSYVSCVYSFLQMHDVVIRLGQRFRTENMPVKIFSAEDLFSNTWAMYARAIYADSVAKYFGDVVAIHQPADAPTPTIITQYRSARQTLENYAPASGRPAYGIGFWNTEVHSTPIDASATNLWGDALVMAKSLIVSLRDGKMGGWLMGSVTVPAGNNGSESIMLERQPGPRYYACKQFFRYIRPGAVMIRDSVDDAEIMSVAFVHKQAQTLTIVMLNSGTAAKDVTISGSSLSFTQVRSSATETCDTIGTVTGTCSLPPNSLTTLYATGYVTSIASGHSQSALRPRAAQTASTEYFDLLGRRIGRMHQVLRGVIANSAGLRLLTNN